jgi:alkylhydroperoxidase family enzyme
VSSALGISADKIKSLTNYKDSPLFDEKEKIALEYADTITFSNKDVNTDLFENLKRHFDDDMIVELTAIIAWENFSSKFNRALRVPSQGFCNDEV